MINSDDKPCWLQEENEKVLKDYLLAHQRGAGCQLPTSPISIQDFNTAYQVSNGWLARF